MKLMEGTQKLAIFFLVFSISFNFFTFAFSFSDIDDLSVMDLGVDLETLYASGILLGDAETHNITYGNTSYTYYETINETSFRVIWGGYVDTEDLRIAERNNLFANIIWVGYKFVPIREVNNEWAINNATILSLWDSDYNWTKLTLSTGFLVFIFDPEGEGNLTRAIYEDEVIGVMIAQSAEASNPNGFVAFVSWYGSIITGNQSYGLPPVLRFVVQLMGMLSVLSVIFLMKEFVPFLN